MNTTIQENEYVVKIWVHPLAGGDDYGVTMTYTATDKSWIKKDVEKWLKKRSSVINDFNIFTKTEYKEHELKQEEYDKELRKKLEKLRKERWIKMNKKQKFCKSCRGFINSGEIPKEEIAFSNWCYKFKECGE